MYDPLQVTGAELIRRIRRLGKVREVAVRFETRPGKGSHGRLYYGERFTTVKDRRKEIGAGLLAARSARHLERGPVMRYAYPVTLEPDADKRVVVRFVDVPEALTDGVDETEALAEAADALAAALAGYARERRPLPRPSPANGRDIVPVPPLAAAKLALCEAMRRQSITKAELARRLDVTEAIVRRLVDPDHASRIEKVQHALAAVGVELIVEEAA